MTREKEIRKAVDMQFPIVLDGRTQEQAIAASGFELGVKWADAHPKSRWINFKGTKPEEGIEVLAYNHEWIDEDFNPNGTRVGFVNGDGEFTSAYWWDYQDSYLTINKSICEENKDFYINHIDNTEPEYWMPIPNLPKE